VHAPNKCPVLVVSVGSSVCFRLFIIKKFAYPISGTFFNFWIVGTHVCIHANWKSKCSFTFRTFVPDISMRAAPTCFSNPCRMHERLVHFGTTVGLKVCSVVGVIL
jgi:hypothetical protein